MHKIETEESELVKEEGGKDSAIDSTNDASPKE